ncbi:MAG TPA: magnesium/cobalt transporter CorA [Armatimonadota bacterium]|nr:magnesium/cobalt transporter CorA [Armatimonadota bacterium]
MIHCEWYQAKTGKTATIDFSQVPSLLPQSDMLLWVDCEHPDDDELSQLASTFSFHPLSMEDVRNQHQRSKVDKYDDYYFFVLRSIDYYPRSHRVDSVQLDLFIGRNYLVSIHADTIPAIAQAHRRWEQAHFPSEAVSYLFYLISDVVIDSYFPIIDSIGEIIDEIDSAILESPTRHTLRNVFTLRKSLLNIRKILAPTRDAFNELIRSEEGGMIFPLQQTRAYFSDVYDHILRLTDFVDTYRDMLSGTLDAYQSSLSNKLNENMQRLTVAATVLASSTVITGFFGMNVRGMMIQSPWRYGGLLVLIILIVTTLIEIWLFRRKGWL